jgi:hypothetical protein
VVSQHEDRPLKLAPERRRRRISRKMLASVKARIRSSRAPGPPSTFRALRLTGLKRNSWLVQTVGVPVTVIGGSLLIDLIYALPRRILLNLPARRLLRDSPGRPVAALRRFGAAARTRVVRQLTPEQPDPTIALVLLATALIAGLVVAAPRPAMQDARRPRSSVPGLPAEARGVTEVTAAAGHLSARKRIEVTCR